VVQDLTYLIYLFSPSVESSAQISEGTLHKQIKEIVRRKESPDLDCTSVEAATVG